MSGVTSMKFTCTRRAVVLAALGVPALAGLPGAPASSALAQSDDGAAVRALVPEAQEPLLEVYPAGALHGVGQDRFAFGVVAPDIGPVEHAKMDVLFFKIADNQGTLTETLSAPFLPYGASESHEGMDMAGEDQDITGIYVVRPTFDVPGSWGIVVRATMPDGSIRAGQADFTVAADSDVPGPGDPAIGSKTPVATTPEEAAKICTADPVDDMHALSLDEALGNGKPTVVLFATPALCTSRVCGPSLEAVQELKKRHGDKANFIHVEIYPDRKYEKPAAAIDEWRLPSEPWLFLIDAAGTVVERYEGGIGLTELDPAIRALIA